MYVKIPLLQGIHRDLQFLGVRLHIGLRGLRAFLAAQTTPVEVNNRGLTRTQSLNPNRNRTRNRRRVKTEHEYDYEHENVRPKRPAKEAVQFKSAAVSLPAAQTGRSYRWLRPHADAGRTIA